MDKELRRIYARNYYHKHREQIRERERKRYHENIELHRKYKHNDYLRHKEKRIREAKEKRKKNKQKVFEVLGDSCKICGSKQSIQYHNAKQEKHPLTWNFILAHNKDFICLCGKCHRTLHHLMTLNDSQINALIGHGHINVRK